MTHTHSPTAMTQRSASLTTDPRTGASAGTRIGLLLALGLLAVAWSRTFREMWNRWFPAWHYRDWSLGDRLMEGNSYYTHGPLVPLICAGLAYWTYRRVGLPCRRTVSASLLGWLIVIGSGLLHLLCLYADVDFASGFALIGLLFGLLLVWGGWTLAKAYWLPVAFLGFMVPLPMDWIAGLNLKLKFLASQAASWMTTSVFGVPVVLDGSFFYLPPDASGATKTLVVEDVCSGLRSLIALMFFSTLFAMVCRVRGPWRVVLFLSALPVAVGCNVLRITTLNLIGHYHSVDMAGPDSSAHDLSGLVVFALALLAMFGLEALILALGALLKRNWADARLMGYLDDLPRTGTTGPGRTPIFTTFALAALTFASISLVLRPLPNNETNFSAAALPGQIPWGDQTATAIDVRLEPRISAVLRTKDITYRRYTLDGRRRELDALIVFSTSTRNGVHPPQVCLEGGGSEVTSHIRRRIEVQGMGAVPLVELVTQRGNDITVHGFVYKYGDHYTASYFKQQLRVLLSGLTTGNSAGALIRFSVPVDDEDIEAGRARIDQAVRAIMPQIDRELP